MIDIQKNLVSPGFGGLSHSSLFTDSKRPTTIRAAAQGPAELWPKV